MSLHSSSCATSNNNKEESYLYHLVCSFPHEDEEEDDDDDAFFVGVNRCCYSLLYVVVFMIFVEIFMITLMRAYRSKVVKIGCGFCCFVVVFTDLLMRQREHVLSALTSSST